MKLSAKSILGFILTNVLYILLLAAVFLCVKTVDTKSDELVNHVMAAYERANNIALQMTQMRYAMRAYQGSPNRDRREVFRAQFVSANQAAAGSLDELDQLIDMNTLARGVRGGAPPLPPGSDLKA